MKKSEKMLLGVVGVATVIFILDTFVFNDEEDATLAKEDDKASSATVSEKQEPESAKIKKRKKQPDSPATTSIKGGTSTLVSWKKDPFLGSYSPALVDSLQGSSPYVLKAISWRGKEAHVIINDEVYKMGEAKDGFLVEGIRDNKVYCIKNGQRFVLRFGE